MRQHPQFKAWMALIAVCFFWGTTYLAIRIALESFPPVVLLAARFLLSGLFTLIAAGALKSPLPRGSELRRTALFGIIVLGIGNGALAFAEQWIPSGLAALFITTGPFWMVGMESLVPGGDRLHRPTIVGMLIGLAGVVFLLSRDGGILAIHGATLTGFLTLQVGCVGWSLGSILQRRLVGVAHPFVSGGIQQLATGLVYLVPAILQNEPIHYSTRGVLAILYLVTFGSMVGYSAYIYSMSKLPVSVVSIYNYVNPVVAVALGWLFYREPFGTRELIAMGIIFTGVYLVKRFSHSGAVAKARA